MPLDHSHSKSSFTNNVRTLMNDVGKSPHVQSKEQAFIRISPFNNEDLAYAAGFFDGEGCVNFTRIDKSIYIRACIVNTNKDALDYIQRLFGGKVTTHPQSKVGWKVCSSLEFCWDEALDFLLLIEPWVKIKKEQIFVAKMWGAIRNKQRGRQHLDQDYYDMMQLLVDQLHWLNRKGPRKTDDLEPIQQCLDTLPISVEQILLESLSCH